MLEKSQLCFYLRTGTLTRIYKLPKQVETSFQASNSVILAMVSFLLETYPQLPHPSYLDTKKTPILLQMPSDSQSDLKSWLHPLFQPWSDLLVDTVLREKGFRKQNTLYLCVEVDQEYEKYLAETDLIKETKIGHPSIHEIFEYEKEKNEIKRRVALPNFAGSQLRLDKLQPKIHVPALLLGLFYDNQKWNYYKILCGQIPSAEQIASHDAIILPGSTFSVLDRKEEVVQFMRNYSEALTINSELRTLAICFGHQLVCDLYDAKVAQKQRKTGQQKVRFSKETISKYDFLAPILNFSKTHYLMPEHHEDYVLDIPIGFDLIGESDSCQIECVVKQDGKTLSMQFHPEYFSEYASIFSLRQEAYGQGHGHVLDFDFGQHPDILEIHHESCSYFRNCMKLFLEGK